MSGFSRMGCCCPYPILHYVGVDRRCLTPPNHKLTDNQSYFQTGKIRGINPVVGEKPFTFNAHCAEMPDVADRKSLHFASLGNADVLVAVASCKREIDLRSGNSSQAIG